MSYNFTPPTTTFKAGTDSLWGRVSNTRGRAVTVYDDGRVLASDLAPAADTDGVTSVYPGGRTYTITDAEAQTLIDAGYSSYLEEL